MPARFLRACDRMVFGLIGAGLGIAQQVMGMVGQAKAAKGDGGGEQKAEAPKGGDAGEAGKAGDAGKAEGGDAPKENPIDKFVEMIGKAGSIADIKKIRDQALGALKPEQQDNAKRKLDQAILKKLGIGQPGPNGDIQVPLTPQNQQILQQLGMKPDEVKDGAGGQAPGPNAAGPNAAPNPAGAAPKPAAAPM